MSECPACGFNLDMLPAMTWSIIIEHTARSGNQIGSSGRGSKGWKYRNERKAVSRSIGSWIKHVSHGIVPTQATGWRRVWVTRLWGKGQRAYDIDNLAWGMKPLFDEIKSRGWIKEDSPKWVERIYHQEKSPSGANAISIRIEEFDV